MENKQQTQINRMLEALDMIAEMPAWRVGVPLNALNAQYEEARETARLAVDQYNRSEADAGGQRPEVAAALREGIDKLHERRGELVLIAKAMRESGEHAAREMVWESVQELTLQIEQAEDDLAKMGGRGAEVRHD